MNRFLSRHSLTISLLPLITVIMLGFNNCARYEFSKPRAQTSSSVAALDAEGTNDTSKNPPTNPPANPSQPTPTPEPARPNDPSHPTDPTQPEPACLKSGDQVRLIAGKNLDVGAVSVTRHGETLTLAFMLKDGVVMETSHVDAAANASELKRAPGQFAFQVTHRPAVANYAYDIKLSELDLDPEADEIFVSTHAVVRAAPGASSTALRCTESAWGKGESGQQVGWGMYFRLCPQ